MKKIAIKKGGKGSSDSVLVTLVVLALLALGSVGCGGSDDNTPDAPAQIQDEWDEMNWDDGEWTHRMDFPASTARLV